MSAHGETLLGLLVHDHGQGLSWWVAFFVANWVTAAAYFAIPLRMAWQRKQGTRRAESLLFEMFVAACGLHHFVMPLGMLFNLMVLQLYVDFAMAGVSAYAAWKLTQTEPFEREE